MASSIPCTYLESTWQTSEIWVSLSNAVEFKSQYAHSKLRSNTLKAADMNYDINAIILIKKHKRISLPTLVLGAIMSSLQAWASWYVVPKYDETTHYPICLALLLLLLKQRDKRNYVR